MRKEKTALRYLINTIALAVLMAVAVMLSFQNNDTMKLKVAPAVWQCCYLIIMAASLNLVLGYLGQLSLGHCGFMAAGAYTAALVSLALQRSGFYTDKGSAAFVITLIVSFLAAGILSALIGLLVGIPALRLKGDYLAIITLGFGMIVVNLINNIPFCGQQGLSQGAASSALYANGLGFSNDEKQSFMWVGVLIVILCMTIMIMFVRSKYGRVIRAIRDNEIAASATGNDVSHYKILTFVFSAFFAGVAGALYSCANVSLATTSFAFTNGSILNSVFIVVTVVVGGMGSMTGSIIAAIGMFLLNYTIKNGAWVNSLPGFLKNVFTYPMLVYSIALIIIIMFRPKGIMGSNEFALCDIPKYPARIKEYFRKKSSVKEDE